MPLVVLSVTEQPRKARELTELQATLPTRSINSRHDTAQGAYHEGLLSKAEHAREVVESIDLARRARTCAPLPQVPDGAEHPGVDRLCVSRLVRRGSRIHARAAGW